MKNTILIPEVYLHTLNAFDVGNNPPHVNQGLLQSRFSSLVAEHSSSLLSSPALTLSGHALELLDEESPEVLSSLIAVQKKNEQVLLGTPYYNTSLSLLSPKNFTKQWHATNDLFEKYFSKRTQTLFVGHQPIPKALGGTLRDLDLDIVGNSTLSMRSAPLGKQNYTEIDTSVGAHSPFTHIPFTSALRSHVQDELKALEPYMMQDELLSQTWSHLGSSHVLDSLNGANPQETYDTYFTLMNILNDVAHTIRTVELSKRGEFETRAEIVEHPSQRILEIINNEVKHA